jgi:chromosome segregation ATPase
MDAGKFNAAADTLQREANRFQQLAEAAQLMRDSGAILAQLNEAQQTLKTLREASVAARAELERFAEEIETARTQAGEIVRQANEQAAQRLAEADAKAQERLGAAQDEASELLEQARAKGNGMIQSAQSAVDTHEQDIRSRKSKLAKLDDELLAKSQELERVNAALREARERVAAFAR